MSYSLATALFLLSSLSSAANPSIYGYRSGTCSNPAIRVCPGLNADSCCDFPFSPGNHNNVVSSTLITSLTDCDVFSWHRQGTSTTGGGNNCGPIRDSAPGPGRRVCLEYRGDIALNYETGGGAMWKDLSTQYPPGCPQIKFPNIYPNYLNVYGISRRSVNDPHGKVTDAPDVPVAELGGCKSREIPTIMEWQSEGHGVWVLEKLSPEQYKAFNELPAANVAEAIANMEKFNAVFFEHWSRHPTAHEAMTHAISMGHMPWKE